MIGLRIFATSLAAMALLAACMATSPTKTLVDRQNAYCSTADPVRRAVLLSIIRSQVPAYPGRGLCTPAGRVLAEAIQRRIEGQAIDIEAARQEQEAARERLQ